jgi:RNA polymerase sigma-70 factor (ECF subfamily)
MSETFQAETSPEAEVLRDEAVKTIKSLVLGLPELQREALLLQIADGLTIREIAIAIGKSPGATNSLLARARETLKQKGSHYFSEETT